MAHTNILEREIDLYETYISNKLSEYIKSPNVIKKILIHPYNSKCKSTREIFRVVLSVCLC